MYGLLNGWFGVQFLGRENRPERSEGDFLHEKYIKQHAYRKTIGHFNTRLLYVLSVNGYVTEHGYSPGNTRLY